MSLVCWVYSNECIRDTQKRASAEALGEQQTILKSGLLQKSE